MKRLLCITANMNAGGAETFLMKIYNNIDRKKYQMDFIVSYFEKNYYEDEIKELGGKIYRVTPKSKNFLKSFFGIMSIVRKNHYDYVMRVNEHSLSTLDLLAARFGGARIVIMRSSNANSGSRTKVALHKIFRFMPVIIPNIKIAPSTEAALYTFGKRQVKKGKVVILKNGLDINKFKYDPSARKDIRDKLNIKDKIVLGHIGRFNDQKNHMKLIEIFDAIHKTNDNTVLILVGKGTLEEMVKKRVAELGLEKSVMFLGERGDVNKILNAFDVLVFPSKYEGMPNVVIEAQATGLRCVISDSIAKEANVTGLVEFASLEKPVGDWVDIVLKTHKAKRSIYADEMQKNGYDIISVARLFEEIVFEGNT